MPELPGITDTQKALGVVGGGVQPAYDASGNVSAISAPGGVILPLVIPPAAPYSDQTFPADDWTLAASGIVSTQRGYLAAVEILSGTGVTLTLQDSPDVVAGRQVWTLPGTSGPRRFDFPKPLPFHTGLFATIGGTSPSVKFICAGCE